MRLLRNLVVLVLILGVALGVFVWLCPADFAYRQLASHFGPVKLDGLSGTARLGHAASVEVFGQNMGALDWQVSMHGLLHGQVVAHVTITGAQLNAAGMLTRIDDGRLLFHDAHVSFPASLLSPALGIPALSLLGSVEVTLDEATTQSAWFDTARGTAVWRDAAVAGAAQSSLGVLNAQFSSTAEGVIAGRVHDAGGPLQAQGDFGVGLGKYSAHVRLSARDGNPQISEVLRYVGQPQGDGSSLLEINGNVLQLL